MIPLDDRQRREHLQRFEVLKLYEASWDAVARDDIDKGLDIAEKVVERLRAIQEQKNKVVVPIRGPKGPGDVTQA